MYTCLGPGAVGIDRPFPDVAELAAAHGFEGIRMDLGYLEEQGPDRYAEVLADHDLRPGSFGLPVAVEDDREEYERDLEALPEIASAAAAVGCTRCSTYVMSFSDERPYEENFEYVADRLERPAEILAEHGIDLGLEFLGPATLREGHAYEFVHTADGMLELCAAVGDTVGLLLDSWHWYTAGGDLDVLRSLEREDVVDVHVNDAPSGIPVDEQIDSERRMPGATGVIDIEPFLQHLDAIGYDGPVMVEPFSDDIAALEPAAAAERTADSLDRVFRAAGVRS